MKYSDTLQIIDYGSNQYLSYKGYYGSAEMSLKDEVLHGKIVNIQGLVTYESDNVKGLINSFMEAVDDYIDYCRKHNMPTYYDLA